MILIQNYPPPLPLTTTYQHLQHILAGFKAPKRLSFDTKAKGSLHKKKKQKYFGLLPKAGYPPLFSESSVNFRVFTAFLKEKNGNGRSYDGFPY